MSEPVPAPQSLRVSEIRDPAVLFERYGTEEIRGVERRVRGEIEQKKEELRQMVGERYRDLIDAADTITQMRECSEGVVRSVKDMSRYCHRLKHHSVTVSVNTTLTHNEQWQEKFYTMASQIKLLLEMPERIWSSMESCQYLQATQLYLLCCHLHRELQLDTSATGTHYSPVLTRFPILIRQVATAGHFRSTILMESKLVLRGRAISDQAITEALVSTMLLEDSSARQALHDFLLARKASIHQLLGQPQHVAGIKAQVCSLVELLVTTLFQAYAVFYLPPEGSPRPGEGALGCGMLFSTLENVTTPTGKGRKVFQDMSTGNWFRYLPASIAEFQPALRTLAQPIQREQLRDTLQQWIDTCKEDMCSGISSLLVYVKSLKGLASIRDAVWDLLSSESISQHWGSVCQQMLERPLAMWEDFLQQLFLQRLQAITREETQAISASCTQLLSSALRDLESPPLPPSTGGNGSCSRTGAQYEADVASFLWSEGAGDLLSDAAWVSVSQRGQQQQQQCGGLAMKTQALTPCVQSFCSSLDAKLRSRLDDLQCYLPSQDKASGTTSAPHSVSNGAPGDRGPSSSTTTVSPFDRFTDAPAVEDTLRENCLACMRHILSSVRSELAAGRPPAHLSAVLFLARLCQSVGELCPNLRRCILGRRSVGTEASGKGTPGQSRKLGKARGAVPEVTPAQAKWTGLNQELFACSMEAYGIWTDALSKVKTVLVDPLAPVLHTQSTGSILTTATNWEEMEIQEEAESGSSVTSKIRLPAQPSWFVQSLLFQLCVEVNRVGGHALPRPTLNQLLRSCLDRALQHYHALTQPDHHKEGQFPMTQNRALQLLFDLRYLSATLGTRPEEGKSSRSQQDPRVQEVCDWLESYIDPFDLDVFTPHLNANLNRLSQRTSVLLGLLTGTEKQFVSRNSSSVTSQEPYNILPLASSQIRFGLLPLSMTNARKAKSAIRSTTTTRPLAPPTSTPANDNTFRPGNLFRQLANQEEETAAPSLFKLGWLSGMSK